MPRPSSASPGKELPPGPRSVLCLDRDSDQYRRDMQRPVAIKVDLWEMSRRRRVAQVLGARDFCDELEHVIRHDYAKSFPEELNRASATLPQQMGHRLPPLPPLNVHQMLNNPPIAIADLPPDTKYSREECVARNKLATLYRLVDLFRWSQGIYNHITLRLAGSEPPEILINPFGLLYHEISAGALIKLNLDGAVLDQGGTQLGVNQAGYVLHSAIHEARPDVHCVLHLHTAVVSAVASMKCGLLPLCQEAMIIGPVAYHDYQGILTDEAEKRSIVQDLGDKNVLLLRNHGFVACGQSVEDALHLAFHTIIACETQIRAARVGIGNLLVPSAEAALQAYQTARKGGGGVNRLANGGTTANGGIPMTNGHAAAVPQKTPSWGIGELEWEAWCRVLDTAGYQTGHLYRQPQPLKAQPPQHNHQCHQQHVHYHSMYNLSSVASPPNGPTSVGAVPEDDAASISMTHRLAALRTRARWLSSPNQYQRVQQLETGGTDAPRVITRWVQQQQNSSATSARSNGGTPVKIHSPHQFTACTACGACGNGREMSERRSRMKEARLDNAISPGPRSQVLDGLTLADPRVDQQDASRARYIGTASKGIIDRDHQHNAQVYRRMYAPNPFIAEEAQEEELKQYMAQQQNGGVQKSKSTPAIAMDTAADTAAMGSPQQQQQSPAMDAASFMQAVKRTEAMNGHGTHRSASSDANGRRAMEEEVKGEGGKEMVRSRTEETVAEGKRTKRRRKGWSGGIFASLIRRKRK